MLGLGILVRELGIAVGKGPGSQQVLYVVEGEDNVANAQNLIPGGKYQREKSALGQSTESHSIRT